MDELRTSRKHYVKKLRACESRLMLNKKDAFIPLRLFHHKKNLK